MEKTDIHLTEFNELSARLRDFNLQKETAENNWDKALDKEGCYFCERFTEGLVDFFVERHKDCDGCPKQKKMLKLAENVDCINAETEEFILNTYAKAVFDYYSLAKPLLVRGATGETYSWEDAFGTQFDEIPKTLRHSLVGLIEGFGRYSFKSEGE